MKDHSLLPSLSLACALLAAPLPRSLWAGAISIAPPIVKERDVLADFLAPEISLRYDYDFPMSLDNGRGDYSMQEYRLSVPVPPVVTDTFVLLASVNYRLFEANVGTDALSADLDLHTIRFPIQAAWMSPSSPWIVIAYAEPGLSTDFNVINSNSFDLSAAVGAAYRFSDNLIIGLGVGYTRNYGDNDFFPAVALLWRPDPHFLLSISPDGVIPEWRVSDDWRVKLKLDFLGGRWTFEDPEGRSRVLRLQGGSVNLLLEHRLFEKCWLTLGAGFNTMADLRIEDSSGHALLASDLGEAVVLRGGLRWTF